MGTNNKKLLLHDNGVDSNERIIIFATEDSLKLLAECDTWFVDGNFNIAPKFFSQLYIVRVKKGEICLTSVFCLLQRKTQESYENMFRTILEECALKNLFPDPKTVHIDFERAAINAVKETFGNQVTIRGCFYHLTQSTHRKIQKLGYETLYRNDEDFILYCAMIDAMAFLPESDLPMAITFLREKANASNRDAERDILEYFDATYVSGSYKTIRSSATSVRFRRVPPIFPPQDWNVRDATINYADRTNNETEGFNNRLRNMVGHSHPTVFHLIKVIRQEFAVDETKMQQASVGRNTVKRKRNKYLKLQEILRNLCLMYNLREKSLEEFLEAVGQNIRFL